MRTTITILTLALLVVSLPGQVAGQTDDEIIAAANANVETRWTHSDTGIAAIIAGAVLAATAFDYSSCGQGFKAEDHPEFGTHCMLTLNSGEVSTYNTKAQLRGWPDGKIGEGMLYTAGALVWFGILMIALPDDNPVTRDMEAGVSGGTATLTKSFGW